MDFEIHLNIRIHQRPPEQIILNKKMCEQAIYEWIRSSYENHEIITNLNITKINKNECNKENKMTIEDKKYCKNKVEEFIWNCVQFNFGEFAEIKELSLDDIYELNSLCTNYIYEKNKEKNQQILKEK